VELNAAIVRRLDGIRPVAWNGVTLRHHSAKYSAVDGEGARVNGGRWNPPNSFAAVYTALERKTIDSEFQRLARRAALPPESFLPRRLARIEVSLTRVLDLTDARTRSLLGVSTSDLTEDDWAPTEAIGLAAHYLGFEAVLAPSADDPGATLCIFMTSLAPESRVMPVEDGEYRPPRKPAPRTTTSG